MNWRDYIHTDPNILVGKPVVKGTRLSVDFILRLFGNGWTAEQVFDSYPQLTPAALQAVFAFAAESLSQETLYAMPVELA
ncbi:MAG: DUF433 domain-containing protein [Caldilineaceae bacterium]